MNRNVTVTSSPTAQKKMSARMPPPPAPAVIPADEGAPAADGIGGTQPLEAAEMMSALQRKLENGLGPAKFAQEWAKMQAALGTNIVPSPMHGDRYAPQRHVRPALALGDFLICGRSLCAPFAGRQPLSARPGGLRRNLS